MTKEQFEELCSAYVLDSLDEQSNIEFQAYLKTTSTEEKKIYNDFRICILQLPLSVQSVEPSINVKETLISRISKNKSSNNIFSFRTIIYVAAAIILAFFTFDFFNSEIDEGKNHLLNNGIMLISHESELPKTFCHSAQNVSLVSNNGQAESAKLTWCQFHKIGYLQINNIADLQKDQSYQLWMTNSEGESTSVGVLEAHQNIKNKVYDIHHLINLKPTANNHFSVTIEALNGVKKSFGKTHLFSS